MTISSAATEGFSYESGQMDRKYHGSVATSMDNSSIVPQQLFITSAHRQPLCDEPLVVASSSWLVSPSVLRLPSDHGIS